MINVNRKLLKSTKLFILVLIASGCVESNHSHFHSAMQKGNESFQKSMSLGAGSFRNPVPVPGNRLNLSESDIVDAKIDPASGAWASVTFDTRKSAAFPQGSDPIIAARDLVRNYANELGFQPEEIVLTEGGGSEPLPNQILVVFLRAYKGLPVKGAFLQVHLAKQADGSLRLSEFVNNSYGAVSIAPEVDLSPGDDEAMAAAGLEKVKVEKRELVIQPAIGSDGLYEFAYATEYKIDDLESDEVYTMTLTNADLRIAEAYSNRAYAKQQFTAEVYKRSYVLNDKFFSPLKFAQIFQEDGSVVTTDADGFADVSGSSVTVLLRGLNGGVGVINNAANPNAFVTFPLTLGANGKTSIPLGSVDIASMNSYAAFHAVTDYVGRFLTSEQLPLLKVGVPARVNVAGGAETCNSHYTVFVDGTNAIFLGGEGSGCASNGAISDVALHEYGHAVDDWLGPTSRRNGQIGMTDFAFSEGIGDILTAYMNRSPNVMPGFYLNNPNPLRVLKNSRKYPPANEAEAEVHSQGLIIAGTFWDLFEEMTKIYGPDEGQALSTSLFLNHLLITERYVDSYQAVLRVDDLDNNPATSSPHKCLITRSFAAHNLSGSDRVGADCVDTDTSIKVRVDTDHGDGKLALLVSAAGASRIVGCDGDVKGCEKSSSGFVEFKVAGDNPTVGKTGRKFFEGTGNVQAKADGSYSIISMDNSGKVLGAKTITFNPRDQSGDDI